MGNHHGLLTKVLCKSYIQLNILLLVTFDRLVMLWLVSTFGIMPTNSSQASSTRRTLTTQTSRKCLVTKAVTDQPSFQSRMDCLGYSTDRSTKHLLKQIFCSNTPSLQNYSLHAVVSVWGNGVVNEEGGGEEEWRQCILGGCMK